MRDILEQILPQFLKNNDRVLICCPRESELTRLIADAVSTHRAIPTCWEGDCRWSRLLRLAFTGKHRVIAGPPHLLLGLCKLSKHRGTPLYIRNAILTEGCPAWVRESIERGLDCRTWFLSEIDEYAQEQQDMNMLQRHLLHWSSVLDCRLVRGSYGLEIQAVIFPGIKLPEFPTCAKLDLQPWEPERHVPFYLAYDLKNPGIYPENH